MAKEIDFTGLEDRLGKGLSKAITSALTATASNGIVMMRQRIEKGIGSSGKAMPAYTQSYKKRRQDLGRPDGKRDLFVSGQMLGGIHLENVEEKKGAGVVATIGIAGARNRELAGYHETFSPWFDFTPGEKESLVKMLRSQLDKSLKD